MGERRAPSARSRESRRARAPRHPDHGRAAAPARLDVHDRGAGGLLRRRDFLGRRAGRDRQLAGRRRLPRVRARGEELRRRARPRDELVLGAAAVRALGLAVALVLAGAADDDAVLLDRDGHRTVPGPVLGVDGIVLDGGVEPQPVALVAVVEGPLEVLAAAGATATAAATAAPAPAAR